MRRGSFALVTLLSLGGCPRPELLAELPDTATSAPSVAASTQASTQASSQPSTSLSATRAPRGTAPEDAWRALAFRYADTVVAVEVKGPGSYGAMDAEVKEEFRGYQTAQVMPLSGVPAADFVPGSRWLVAAYNNGGASAARQALAWLPDTATDRAEVERLMTPAWRYTPLVLVVKIEELRKDERVMLSVVEVLRGAVTDKQMIDNVWGTGSPPWSFAKFRPFAVSGQLYVLSAWDVSRYPASGEPLPFFYAEDLRPIALADIAAIKGDLAGDPYGVLVKSLDEDTLERSTLETAWRFWRAPLVAETRVTTAYDEPTGCGGLHYTMSPIAWLRGEATAGSLPASTGGGMIWGGFGGGVTPGAPALFVGGGHCYWGAEKFGAEFLAAGWSVGGAPVATLPRTAANRAQVDAWLGAPPPRFEAGEVDARIFSGAVTVPAVVREASALFEPEMSPFYPGRGFVRFEVVARVTTTLPDGRPYSWIHCRLLPEQHFSRFDTPPVSEVTEWMFEGTALPEWPEGSRWWGFAVEGVGGFATGRGALTTGTSATAVSGGRLFIPSLFLPGEDGLFLEDLLRATQKVLERRVP